MRLWSKQLISVLPKNQLVAQWRELSAIAGAIQKKGTPNHILVNFVLDYDFDHFISYAHYVRLEMTKRGYKTMDSVWNKIVSLKKDYNILPLDEVYTEKMDEDYFLICYYNLNEKHICGGISEEDWQKIGKLYFDEILKKRGVKYYCAVPPEWIVMEGDFGDSTLCCPTCKKPITNVWSIKEYEPNYCHYCGQRLYWKRS